MFYAGFLNWFALINNFNNKYKYILYEEQSCFRTNFNVLFHSESAASTASETPPDCWGLLLQLTRTDYILY